MRTEPALTYSGALSILGQHDHRTFEALNRLTGGLMLAGAAVGANLLGYFDPKGEASGLVRQLLDRAADRLLGTAGYERMELISAAHTVVVISSFFDALRHGVGPQEYGRLRLTRAEKALLVSVDAPPPPLRQAGESLLDKLVMTELPMPSPRRGWHEHVSQHMEPYLRRVADQSVRFLSGLEAWRYTPGSDATSALMTQVVAESLRRYTDAYQRLAAQVPELLVWASWGEHAATRHELREMEARLSVLLGDRSRTMDGLARILVAATSQARAAEQRDMLAAINSAALDRSVVATDALRYAGDVAFPSVRDGYVTPAFRFAVASSKAMPSQEAWWSKQPLREDLDSFLAAHLASPEGCRLPLLVLGHPGAGKSLLTKVLAAQLPPTGFAAVRVPLRAVEAGAAVHRQIAQALERETHGRVSWPSLAAESRDVTRVVLLDGLDELIQATGIAQSEYLQQVAEFQERERDLKSPMAVVVTSRTVVADRARIPDGSLMIKLEDFDQPRIVRWLEVWRQTNEAQEAAGTFRALGLESALRHVQLAAQPLLLLMLALYAADPRLPDPGDQVLSTAGLYQRLLDNFARRELRKSAPRPLAAGHDTAVAGELWHLGLAAFGMFNRGRQQIAESELETDMNEVIGPAKPVDVGPTMEAPVSRAQRTVGKFFFVHAAEADTHRTEETRRTYEFLHATFGEYLVAATTIDLLREAARRRESARRSPYGETPRERHLPLLLSHQPFLKRRPIITFAQELFRELPPQDAEEVRQALEELAAEARQLDQSALFALHNPSGGDAVARLATYSANLVALCTLLTGGVPLARLAPPGSTPDLWWSSTVRLWHAGLDDDGWAATLTAFRVRLRPYTVDGRSERWLMPNPDQQSSLVDDVEAHAMAVPHRADRLRLGTVVYQRLAPHGPMPGGLERLLEISLRPPHAELRELYREMIATTHAVPEHACPLLLTCLARDAEHLPLRTVVIALDVLFRSSWAQPPHLPDIAKVFAAHPQLLTQQRLAVLAEAFGPVSAAEWTRLLTGALLSRPGGWPADQEELAGQVGETFCQAVDLMARLPTPVDE
ncbi:hypothetical protein GCM10022251_72980 [Phytohabitans flavus]|uniref:AAA+ ATPase domain-containing protein n=1 Tax=Phytohabitans flavus TaxID=1076124 RepID=A0A6F8XKH3_9ACTN|nr:ATP-binding protein [Phytohabitans flavus]BCB74312.1 hypothetical protein Pflav_007220 [Phytohabitans flavus]